MFTLYSANTDGGVTVIDNYYDKGLRWDATAAARARAEAMALDAAVQPVTGAEAEGFRVVELTIRDSAGAPVTELRGTLRATRPHTPADVTVPLARTDTPGLYRQQLPLGARGLWDLELDAKRPDADGAAVRFLKTFRVEI